MKSEYPEVLYFSTNGKELLNKIIGKKITRMFHYYLGNENEFQQYLRDLPDDISCDQVFSLIEGPLLIEFNSGEEISFFADEHMQSIAFSYEKNEKGEYVNSCQFYTPQDLDNNPYIDVNDQKYSNDSMREFINKKIIDIELYRQTNVYPHSTYRISDAIIQFTFEDEGQMTLGYNIHSSTVMAVLPWKSVHLNIRDEINEVVRLSNDVTVQL
jgi:hypothetical protein